MGAGQSTSQAHLPSHALHVLRVTPSSPASHAAIEPFFDFIVGFEGDSLSSNSNISATELEKIVESHEGRVLNLLVWNSKSQGTRVVPIIPSREWSEESSSQKADPTRRPSLLGLSMRMCEPEFALDNVWHVLDVMEGSPAESAGLVPYGDYITGWSGGVLSAENDFYDLVEAHVDKPLRVYVYSYDFDALREVVLVPNRHWGGEGLLGCVFGYGLLHRIPPQNGDRVPGSTPPELADELEEQELFVPADVHAESEYSPTQLEEWRRQEQEQWNHESTEARFMYEAKAPGADHDTISPIGEEDGAQTPVDERRRSPEQPSFIAQDTPRNTPPRQASIPAQSHLSRNFLGTSSPTFSFSRYETVGRYPTPTTPTKAASVSDGSDDGSVLDAASHGSLTSVE